MPRADRAKELPSTVCFVLCLASAGLSLSACADVMPRLAQGLGVEEEPRHAEAEQPKQQQVGEAQYLKLAESLSAQVVDNQELEENLTGLQLQLFEREAQLRDLNERLGEAILEVVRAKAKLRSLDTKGEAASNLAEAEVAMKALKAESAGADQHPASAKALELLGLAVREFERENYGGALYLTNQAKSLIQNSQEHSVSRENLALLPGEVPFDLPVPLRARTRSNLRVGPGTNFKILAAVEDGAPLVGHSYKGRWIRVRATDERVGWVFYKLVEVP